MAEKGQRIAERYELVERLGEGGMGVVWRGRDTRLGRNVAVKLLPASAVGNETARTRLIREARAAAALEVDGIVRVYDVGEIDGGGAFLVMELVRGSTLREALEKRALGFAGVIQTVISAARALGAAHEAGIVHRDVKPDNIMIRDDGRVIVVDFGVAKPVATELLATAVETVAGVTSASLTGAGQLVGTPAYLSPEQARGVEVNHATDQFALAVTAYEALTGKLPWTGTGVVEIVASLLRDEAPPVSGSVPLPPALDDVIARALAKEPAKRWPDMKSFADALDEILPELPVDPSGRPSNRPSGKSRVVLSTPKGGTNPVIAVADASPAATTGGRTRKSDTGAPASTSPMRNPLVYGLGILALGAIGYATMHTRMGMNAVPTTPPVKTESVACPPFAVAGMDAWIGGAAAAIACERVQMARGGADARTAAPAEIADAPRDCIQPIRTDLFDDAGARDRYVGAGKARGGRYLDGTVERQLHGYSVEIALRDPSGAELARGKAMGVELFEAVRDALKPALAALPPLDAAGTASMKEWLDVESAADLSDLYDVRTAILIEDLVSLKEACTVVEKKTTLTPRVAYFAKLACSRKLRTGKPSGPIPPIDETSPGALITTSLAQGTDGGPSAVRERGMRLQRLAETTSNPEGKARLLAAAADIYNQIGDPVTRQVARMAVQASPKAFDWRTSSWHRVVFASEGDDALGSALAAWQPWEPMSQSLQTHHGVLAGPELQAVYTARTYALGQRGFFAGAYGDLLLSEGNVEAARGVAELANDDLLRVGVLLGEAKYGEAVRTIPPMVAALPATEEKAAKAFRLAGLGVRAALVLGRPTDFVEGVVSRYVESEPHAVVDGVVPFGALVTACCFAPKAVGKRCIDRIQQLRTDGRLPTIFIGVDKVLEGASRFVAEDYVGATRSWRQLLRASAWIQDSLRDSLSIAFDRANEPDLAEEVDSSTLRTIDRPRTAELAWVRAARRAAKKGDNARARKLAQAVVDRWRFADEDIPAVAEMKTLLAKLPP